MNGSHQSQATASGIIGMGTHSRKLFLCPAREEGERCFKVASIATILETSPFFGHTETTIPQPSPSFPSSPATT